MGWSVSVLDCCYDVLELRGRLVHSIEMTVEDFVINVSWVLLCQHLHRIDQQFVIRVQVK